MTLRLPSVLALGVCFSSRNRTLAGLDSKRDARMEAANEAALDYLAWLSLPREREEGPTNHAVPTVPPDVPPKLQGFKPMLDFLKLLAKQTSSRLAAWFQVCGGLPPTSLQIRLPQASTVPFLHVVSSGK